MLEMLLLAQTAPIEPVSHAFLGQLVAGLIALGALGTVFGFQIGKRKVTVEPQPLAVKLEEHFVTRREFDKLEASMARDVMEMKGLFQRTMQAIETQNTTLTKKIENQGDRLSKQIGEVASGAYAARGKMHVTINAQGKQIAALEAKHDVAVEVGKLADALTKTKKTDGQ